MLNISQKKIIVSLLKLLTNFSFDDITVKSVIGDSGLNRNTFYYHYPDLKAALQSALHDRTSQLIVQNRDKSSLSESVTSCYQYVMMHRAIINNIYNSSVRDMLKHYIDRVISQLVYDFTRKSAAGYKLDATEVMLVGDYHKYALEGFIFDWLYNSPYEGAQFISARFLSQLEISVNDMLKRYANDKMES